MIFHQSPDSTIHQGNALEVLATLPEGSVDMCVTSPPYLGLRKYSGPQDLIWGGLPDCEHLWGDQTIFKASGGTASAKVHTHGTDNFQAFTASQGQFCQKCHAWRGAYGLEPNLEMYIEHTITVLRAIRRVMAKHAVCFWNLGDSYAANGTTGGGSPIDIRKDGRTTRTSDQVRGREPEIRNARDSNLKPLDMCLIPERVAIAAETDGWWVRSMIIWHKPNPMPESIRGWFFTKHRISKGGSQKSGGLISGKESFASMDKIPLADWQDCPGCPKCLPNDGLVLRKGSWRPTSSYEHVIFMAKDKDYFADGFSVREGVEVVRENMIQYSHGNESLQQMSFGFALDGIPQGTENEDGDKNRVQGMRKTEDICLEKNRKGKIQRTESTQALSRKRIWKSENSCLQAIRPNEESPQTMETIRSGESIRKILPQISEAESSIKTLRPESKGEGQHQKTMDVREGASQISQGGSQAPIQIIEHGKHGNGGGMGCDIRTAPSSLSLLPSQGEIDDGSRDPTQQGRSAYSNEHSPSLSFMQCLEGKQEDNACLGTRNLRDVWTINTQPFKGAHFATFPEEIPRRCILIGTSDGGYCSKCGAPRARVIEHKNMVIKRSNRAEESGIRIMSSGTMESEAETKTLGFKATCSCNSSSRPGIVLDPFAGSGTTGMVARQLGRHSIMIELSEDYCRMDEKRLTAVPLNMGI